MLYSKEPVYYNESTIDRRIHNGTGNTSAKVKANDAKDLNIDQDKD